MTIKVALYAPTTLEHRTETSDPSTGYRGPINPSPSRCRRPREEVLAYVYTGHQPFFFLASSKRRLSSIIHAPIVARHTHAPPPLIYLVTKVSIY